MRTRSGYSRKMKREPEVWWDINILLIWRPAESGEDVLNSFYSASCWSPCLTATDAWSSLWELWEGFEVGGTLKSQVKKEGSTQPYKSPLFILHMGETEARKKNVIYSRSWFAKSMLRLERVSPWLEPFSRTQECPAHSKVAHAAQHEIRRSWIRIQALPLNSCHKKAVFWASDCHL